MALFRKRLKENVKNKLMRTGAILLTLDIIIIIIIDIDDKLHYRAMEKNPEKYRTRRAGYVFIVGTYEKSSNSYSQKNSMQLDSIRKVKTDKRINKIR